MIQLLLVDDEPVLLNSMVNNDWASVGIDRVHQAVSGLEAVQIMQETDIQIVVTDIRMPGMDGLQLCKYVHDHYPSTKCLLLSGYGEFEYARQAMAHGTVNYLLKPIRDEELLEEVSRVKGLVEQERQTTADSFRARQTLHSHLPLLRGSLLQLLLEGLHIPEAELAERLAEYQLPFAQGDLCRMLLLRQEGGFGQSEEDMLLYEFAVHNMVCELLEAQYHVWYVKDAFGYMCFVLKPKREHADEGFRAVQLDRAARDIQQKVAGMLKGGPISVMVSGEWRFPGELAASYRLALNEFRKLPRSDRSVLIHSGELRTQFKSLDLLYTPPSFQQLLEAGRWQDARIKLEEVLLRMKEGRLDTEEHMLEVTCTLLNAFLYVAHLRGKTLLELTGQEIGRMGDPRTYVRPEQIKNWAGELLDSLEAADNKDSRDGKNQLFSKIHQFIEAHVSEDVSLQTIADHVNLHPVYLSSLYKQERKENISDYIMRYRMEKAGVLLHTTDIKIYELASRLGFQNPPYFSKLFKQYYGVTPQEYRDRHGS